jgi:hypothetical protein
MSLPATMPKRQVADSEYCPVICVPVPFNIPGTATGQLTVEIRVTDIVDPPAITPRAVPFTDGWPSGNAIVQVPANWVVDVSRVK